MKKKISAEIVCDSLSPQGHRLTTYVVTFPRIVLAEFNTHRMFSRNSASSRAIPFKKMVEMVKTDPFIPVAWQKDHSGMQGTEYETQENILNGMKEEWLKARDNAVDQAELLNALGTTKQLVNRLLESFMWHTAICTSHEFENFFHLRCPQYKSESGILHRSKEDYIFQKDYPEEDWGKEGGWSIVDWLSMNQGGAEIHISLLAEAMWDAYNASQPKQLKAGEWHIPFGDRIDDDKLLALVPYSNAGSLQEHLFNLKLKIASARCARVSYMNYEGRDDYKADLKLFDRLIIQDPIHASPVEHCARAMNHNEYYSHFRGQGNPEREDWDGFGWSGNFRGFIQYRKMFQNENKI